MKVSLINYTQNAVETLIFTKQTRLNMTAARFDEVSNLTDKEKMVQLEYMANTIPSSWEFIDYIFAIEGVSRGFTHQFVRTRTNSYAQQSMRVTDMEGFDYITGPSIGEESTARVGYDWIMDQINKQYKELIDSGVAIEDARGILPTNIATNIVAKINLRTLSDMARSRTGGRTQGEYRDVLNNMLNCVLGVHPWATVFLFPKGRDFFDELEHFAVSENNLTKQNALRKIIDKMRKSL